MRALGNEWRRKVAMNQFKSCRFYEMRFTIGWWGAFCRSRSSFGGWCTFWIGGRSGLCRWSSFGWGSWSFASFRSRGTFTSLWSRSTFTSFAFFTLLYVFNCTIEDKKLNKLLDEENEMEKPKENQIFFWNPNFQSEWWAINKAELKWMKKPNNEI